MKKIVTFSVVLTSSLLLTACIEPPPVDYVPPVRTVPTTPSYPDLGEVASNKIAYCAGLELQHDELINEKRFVRDVYREREINRRMGEVNAAYKAGNC